MSNCPEDEPTKRPGRDADWGYDIQPPSEKGSCWFVVLCWAIAIAAFIYAGYMVSD